MRATAGSNRITPATCNANQVFRSVRRLQTRPDMIRPADAVGVSAADVTDAPSQATNVSDAHNAVPSGHFFAGQTDAGVVLLCEVVEGNGGKHCAWVDLGPEERIALMEALHASRCDLYFHWNASLARPRIVGRKGSPVRLQAHLLPVDRRGVELIATLEGSKQRLLGVVAESKELAVQGLVEWIECADELDVEAPSPCISSSSDSSRSSG